MCGIAGILHFDPARHVEAAPLEAMGRALRHRGPDDEGLFLDGPIGFAHRRLSIIDPSERGRQPMATPDGRFHIVYNGEVYNYLELRQRLIGRGVSFVSGTDTEVVLRLYEAEGPDCVEQLLGMFAFAIWDARERKLFLARDRFGIKPLYITADRDTLAFASEIKALFAAGLLEPALRPEGLADYVSFQFCLGDKTLFRGVEKLMPGQWMIVRADGQRTLNTYWDLDYAIDTHHTEEYFEHQLLRLLEDSVRLRLRADVPVGAHLSGGLDSSTVAGLGASLLGAPIHTFSGGFHEGPAYDETAYARAVSSSLGSIHHEVFPTAAELVDRLPRLIYMMDEPVAGPGVFPQLRVSELAAQHVKVVLGGQGGDEVFGGYTRYLIAYLEECIRGGIEGSQDDEKYVVTFESILPNLTQLQGYEPLLAYFWNQGVFAPVEERYFRLIDRSEGIRHLFTADALNESTRDYRPFDAFVELFRDGAPKSLINKMTRFDLKTLLPALLHVEDRTSMSVSLESRVPLLDHRIAELVASMPPMVKYEGGRSKHIFRRVVRHLVPQKVLARTDKMGFPVPLTEWYGTEPVRGFVRETLLGDRARQRGLFEVDQVEPLLASERPYGRGVWGLLCLELWMQAYLDGDSLR